MLESETLALPGDHAVPEERIAIAEERRMCGAIDHKQREQTSLRKPVCVACLI
jgi:hypothetical protein